MKGPDFRDSTSVPPARTAAGRGGSSWRVAAVVLGVVCVIFVGGFAVFAARVSQMETPRDVPHADGIVVLTGGQSRLDAALSLLKAGKGKRLLISGVNPIARADDLRIATGGEEWLFTCCVDIDHQALDTIGNAEESAKWVHANAYASIILVTNNYHMPRSLLEMHRLVRHVDLLPYPVVNAPLEGGAWLTKPDAIRVLLTEYMKYLAAIARGVLPGREAPADLRVVRAVNGEQPHE